MVTLGNFEPKTSSTIPKSTLNSAKNSSLFVAVTISLGLVVMEIPWQLLFL
jgi:hypothetical protein